jgi:sulfur carrier protein
VTAEGIDITVNGAASRVAPGTTVASLVRLWCESDRGVAVAIERDIVPRSLWEVTALSEGARVEIVGAAAGG